MREAEGRGKRRRKGRKGRKAGGELISGRGISCVFVQI